jgi:hypothetical protein
MIRKEDILKRNQIETPLLAFMESYNKSIPADFPHPSVKILKAFQALHPMLFKHGDEWSIDKHRKRLMDWLPSYSILS